MTLIRKGLWKPTHQGEFFCSPRCGFGCTKAAYDRATREAIELAGRLGGDWEPHVWENCGWHYKVLLDPCQITVRFASGGSAIAGDWTVVGYVAWINTRPQFISDAFDTPEEAFRGALDKMQAVFEQMSTALDRARSVGYGLRIEGRG